MPRINQKTLRTLSNDDLDRLLQAAIDEGQDELGTNYCRKLWNERHRRINLARRRSQQATISEVLNAPTGSTVTLRLTKTCELLRAYRVRSKRIGDYKVRFSWENKVAPDGGWVFRASRYQKSGKLNSSTDWYWFEGTVLTSDEFFFEVYDYRFRFNPNGRKLNRSLDLDWKDRLEVAP